MHYDPEREIGAAAYVLADGFGAVLFHTDIGGVERPVYFASRVLSDAERNYSQVEKEVMAIIFASIFIARIRGCIFISGRHFTLYTDHRPLLKIFGPHEETPATTSARL